MRRTRGKEGRRIMQKKAQSLLKPLENVFLRLLDFAVDPHYIERALCAVTARKVDLE